MASKSWADDDSTDIPPPPSFGGESEEAAPAAEAAAGGAPEEDDDGPPPGFEAVKPTAPAADGGDEGEQDDDTDAPDKLLNTLQDDAETEIKTVTSDNSMYSSAKTFEELGLSKELLDGLYNEMKFERPSRIQASTLPLILAPPFRHLIAQAHNGSGKTTCFTLAMLSRVDPGTQEPQAICLCPTRELVVQNLMVLEKMGKHTGITATSTATSSSGPSSRSKTKIKDQIIIGTHGTLKNWVSKRMLSFKFMTILVFDEADDMLKADGFADDSLRMMKEVKRQSPDCQMLLFSATFNERVKRFTTKVLPDAVQVFVPKEDLSLDVIKQYRVDCPTVEDKTKLLKDMVLPNCENLGQTIIFVKTRKSAKDLSSELTGDGFTVTCIQGEMEHEERDRVVREFRDGITKILIATDVLARGFDVSQVTLVINYDIPVERSAPTPAYETYLHRIGRSGRFGRKGAAFNLTTGGLERKLVDQIASYYDHDIESVPHDDEDVFLEVLEKAGLRSAE
mmetsp:Transcript_1994/g.5197  ORF Transcript_1994/g.5197 Transcript_1994/m.5197 type:complete len:508 (+) Transcript_1994:268-1791(+)|eukprot:jgi/Tetstr1/426783/TSEL_016998.t1